MDSRAVAAIALVLSLLSIPVNCALADGPHSIFVPVGQVVVAEPGAQHQHVHPTASRSWPAALQCAGPVEPGDPSPAANSLPTPATALTVLVAVTADDVTEAMPLSQAVLPAEQAAPSACHATVDLPPPRTQV